MRLTIKILVLLNILAVFGLVSVARADAYLDLGIALADGYEFENGSVEQCRSETNRTKHGCGVFNTFERSETGLMGMVELGYTSGKYTAFFMHLSGINDSDGAGINMVGVKYRFSLK